MKYVLIVALIGSILIGCGPSPMTTTQHIVAAKAMALQEIGNDHVQQLFVVQRGSSIELRVYFIDQTKDNLYVYHCTDAVCSFALDNSSPLMSHSSGLDGFVPYEAIIKTIERHGIAPQDFAPISSYLVDTTTGPSQDATTTAVWSLSLHSSTRMNSLDISIDAESGEIITIKNALTGERIP
jgi:hypothetical protein